jgi:hypothetical protein
MEGRITQSLFLLLLLQALVLALHFFVPARDAGGYVRDSKGKPLRYRLNGLRVLLITILIWAISCCMSVFSWTLFCDHRWPLMLWSCVVGFALSCAVIISAPKTSNLANINDFFLGRLSNPQIIIAGRVLDVKMLLYLVGVIRLEINCLSFGASHYLNHSSNPNPGVLIYVAEFSYFVFGYLNFEEVHLYTYDFFAENVGFKLCWGCFCFYPYFYVIGLWKILSQPNPRNSSCLYMVGVFTFFSPAGRSRGVQTCRNSGSKWALATHFSEPNSSVLQMTDINSCVMISRVFRDTLTIWAKFSWRSGSLSALVILVLLFHGYTLYTTSYFLPRASTMTTCVASRSMVPCGKSITNGFHTRLSHLFTDRVRV